MKSENQIDEVSLKDIIQKVKSWYKYLCKKWIVIFIATTIGGAIGLWYAVSQKTIYISELSFALEEDQGGGGLGGALGLASQFGLDIGGSGGGAFAGENLLELMKSRSMIEQALLNPVVIDSKRLTLAEYYIQINQGGQGSSTFNIHKFPVGLDRTKFSRQQDSVLGKIYRNILGNNLTVQKKDKKTSIVLVRVKSNSEAFSKYFTETLVQQVSDFYIHTKTKKSSTNLAIIQHQTDSVRRALYLAISGVASNVDINPNPNQALQILRVPSQRRQVDVQANTAILSELVKNLELAKVSLRRETPLIQIIDRPSFPLMTDKISKLRMLILGAFVGGFLSTLCLIIRYSIVNYGRV